MSPEEYESIFEHQPSFYEKKAFSELFMRKWKEEKGYCSKFTRRPIYKEALQEFKDKISRSMSIHTGRTTSKGKRTRPQTSTARIGLKSGHHNRVLSDSFNYAK